MTDANILRQSRHEFVMANVACPKCLAQPTQTCREWIQLPHKSHGRIYPDNVMKRAIEQAAMSTGKEMVNTAKIIHMLAGRMHSADQKYRDIGGLHKERWSALTDLDVVRRMAEIE